MFSSRLIVSVQISRLHATIYKNGLDEWMLVDKGSRNGCFVNGVKTLQQKLSHGDIIAFGGGGMLKPGTYKAEIDTHFIYQFFDRTGTTDKNGP